MTIIKITFRDGSRWTVPLSRVADMCAADVADAMSNTGQDWYTVFSDAFICCLECPFYVLYWLKKCGSMAHVVQDISYLHYSDSSPHVLPERDREHIVRRYANAWDKAVFSLENSD